MLPAILPSSQLSTFVPVLYDMQHEAAHQATLDPIAMETTRHAIVNRLPKVAQDWHDKWRAVDCFTQEIKGVVHPWLATRPWAKMWSLYDGQDVLNEIDPQFGENITRHIQRVIDEDLFHVFG